MDLPSRLADLARLGLRLPETIKLERGPDAPNLVGFALFVFDDHGFTGEGNLVCQTGRLTCVAIDAWPRAVASRASLGGSGP